MINLLVDTHSHFDATKFDQDRDAAFNRARAAHVNIQIVPAISAKLWEKMKIICQNYNGLYPAYGLHPMFLAEHETIHLTQLPYWLEQEKAVAVGECGLDYFIKELDQKQQIYFFS